MNYTFCRDCHVAIPDLLAYSCHVYAGFCAWYINVYLTKCIRARLAGRHRSDALKINDDNVDPCVQCSIY